MSLDDNYFLVKFLKKRGKLLSEFEKKCVIRASMGGVLAWVAC